MGLPDAMAHGFEVQGSGHKLSLLLILDRG